MTEYVKISKELGWEGTSPALPKSIEDAEAIVDAAKNGSRSSFKYLFAINRFHPSPTPAQMAVFTVCVGGFQAAAEEFRKVV